MQCQNNLKQQYPRKDYIPPSLKTKAEYKKRKHDSYLKFVYLDCSNKKKAKAHFHQFRLTSLDLL